MSLQKQFNTNELQYSFHYSLRFLKSKTGFLYWQTTVTFNLRNRIPEINMPYAGMSMCMCIAQVYVHVLVCSSSST